MDSTSPIVNFYLSSSIIAAAEFADDLYDHYDEDDLINPSYFDAFQSYIQRYH